MLKSTILTFLKAHPLALLIVLGAAGYAIYLASRKKSGADRLPPNSNAEPIRGGSGTMTPPVEKAKPDAPFSKEEALHEVSSHAKALEGCYEDLYQAMETGDTEGMRRKFRAIATRFRNLKDAPRAKAWFERISANLDEANVSQLRKTAAMFFDALRSIGLDRCPDTSVPDNDETMDRYVFSGSGSPVDGGPYKVLKAAWLLHGKVVEKGFIDNP